MEGFDEVLKIATFVAEPKKDLDSCRYLGQFGFCIHQLTLLQLFQNYFEERLKHFYLKAR